MGFVNSAVFNSFGGLIKSKQKEAKKNGKPYGALELPITLTELKVVTLDDRRLIGALSSLEGQGLIKVEKYPNQYSETLYYLTGKGLSHYNYLNS